MSGEPLLTPMRTAQRRPWGKPLLIGLAVGALGLWIAVAILPLLALFAPWFRVSPEWAERVEKVLAQLGTAGDMFGSVNALFSALALLGVAYAVNLQRQEVAAAELQLRAAEEQLAIAKDSAKGEEAARMAAERMQVEQARTLQITTRLNAVQAISQASGQLANVDDKYLANRERRIEELKLANQYARIVLDDVEQDAFDWGSSKERDRSIYLKHLVLILQRSASMMELAQEEDQVRISGRVSISMSSEKFLLTESLQLLRRQPGVFGTLDENRIRGVLADLRRIENEQVAERAQLTKAHPIPQRVASSDPVADLQHMEARRDAENELRKLTESLSDRQDRDYATQLRRIARDLLT